VYSQSVNLNDQKESAPQRLAISSEDPSSQTTQTDKIESRGLESSQSARAVIAVIDGQVSIRHSHGKTSLFRPPAFLLSYSEGVPENVPMINVSIMDPGFGREGLNYSAQTPPSPLNSRAWTAELNRVREAQMASITAHQRLMTSTIVVSAGMSVGYVVWLLRGGLLLGSLLSSLPAWQVIDPLPVLARSKRLTEEAPSADPLEHLFNRVRAIVSGSGESSVRRAHSVLCSASLGATDDARVSSIVINNAKAAT
jgi:hypothetical protein